MIRINSIVLFLASLLVAAASPSFAGVTGVEDGGAFFSPDTVSRANDLISRIASKHSIDLLVQTVAEVPQSLQATYNSQGKGRFFDGWARRQAKEKKVQGIYVLICRNPSHLQIVSTGRVHDAVFTQADTDEMAATMVESFKDKDFDAGLMNGLQFAQQRLDAREPQGASAAAPDGAGGAAGAAGAPAQQRSPGAPAGPLGFSWGGLLCLGVIAIVVIGLLRRMFARPPGYGPGGYQGGPPPAGGYPPGQGYGYGGGGGGGGGFGRGLLGGLLGGALGSWGYDRLSRGGGIGGGDASGGNAPPASGADTGYASSGADFDTSSSGSDFGSSDTGGGDFGGGGGDSSSGADFGGGGDSGGGGGSGGDF